MLIFPYSCMYLPKTIWFSLCYLALVEIFEVEMLIKTRPTQFSFFSECMLYSYEVVFMSITSPDENFQYNLHAWIDWLYNSLI